MAELDNKLLQEEVKDSYKILSCTIEIFLNERDYNRATYIYKYEIKKISESNDEWREVFAYTKKDFKVKYATPNIENPDISDSGLNFKVKSLENNTKNACLKIAFDKHLDINDTYKFSYKCATKIEAISNVNRIFGGDGCVWYWIAHEFECDYLQIIFHIPQKLTIKDTHPTKSLTDKNSVFFDYHGLVSNEFVSALITYEKKFLGLRPKYSKWIQTFIVMIIGSLITIGLTLLLT